MWFRILSFIGVALLSVFITPLIAIPVAIWYAMRWYGPEIILLGALIDVYFGTPYEWPFYSLTAFLIVIATEISRRYLMLK